MSLTPQEAALHLEDAARTGKRSAQAFGYGKASPHLLLWGAIWVLGYGASDVFPYQAGQIWLVLNLFGTAGSVALGARSADKFAARKTWIVVGAVLTLLAFLASLYAIVGPLNPAQYAAIPALMVACGYTCMGLWLGVRMLVTGILIFALTLGGYFLLHQHFLLWMAFVGGGSLILGGLWLRKV